MVLRMWMMMWRDSTYPMAFKSLHATATLGALVRHSARGGELPHLDGLVQTAADKVLSVGREGDTVDAILVSIGALETLDKEARVEVPNTNTFIQRSGRHILGVGRDRDGGDAIFDRQRQNAAASLNIPKPDGAVSTARGNGATVTSKVQRVDILLVTRKLGSDLLRCNIPDLCCARVSAQPSVEFNSKSRLWTYPDKLILRSRGQILAIGTEANAADVKISDVLDRLVLEHADLVASRDIKDLSGAVAAGGHILSIGAEPHTAHNALVLEGVEQIHVENARHVGVEYDKPVISRLLGVGGKTLNVEIAQRVRRLRRWPRWRVLHDPRVVRGRVVGDLRRLSRSRVRHGRIDLRRRRAASRGPANTAALTRSRRSGALRWLRGEVSRTRRGLGILLLEGRLLLRRRRRRRRGASEAGRRLGHLMLRRLLLLLRRRRRRGKGLASLTGHDGTENVVAHTEVGRLCRTRMLRRAAHASLRHAAAGLELAAQMRQFFLVSTKFICQPVFLPKTCAWQICSLIQDLAGYVLVLERNLRLLHLVNLLANHVHLGDLALN